LIEKYLAVVLFFVVVFFLYESNKTLTINSFVFIPSNEEDIRGNKIFSLFFGCKRQPSPLLSFLKKVRKKSMSQSKTIQKKIDFFFHKPPL